jgi:hypothetical protein
MTGGASGTGGATGTGEPCVPEREFTTSEAVTLVLHTTNAICFRVQGSILGWGCDSMTERTVKVNGIAVLCAQLPLPPATTDGWYYFDVSAGRVDYASVYWWH